MRSFAVQVKHIASSNYFFWSPLTGDPVPASIKDGNGPADVKTKADILKFLRDSFSLGHKAAATLTPQNMLEPPAGSRSSRLHLAEFGVAHAYNHYGQHGRISPHERNRPTRQSWEIRLSGAVRARPRNPKPLRILSVTKGFRGMISGHGDSRCGNGMAEIV